jgi:hypothetical protein
MAARVAINHVLAIDQLFYLTQETYYQEYAYAVRSNIVTVRWRLLPPEFPLVEVNFHFSNLPLRFHGHCPWRGVRVDTYVYSCDDADEAISELLTCKDMF